MKLPRPNIYVAAFLFGAVVLTVLPFLQKRFLKAPPPIQTLPSWTLLTSTGEQVGSAQLAGHVWLASFVAAPCDAQCTARQEFFGRSLEHIRDTDGGVVMVSLTPEAPSASQPGWYVLGGEAEPRLVEAFRQGWVTWAGTDAGSTAAEFARLPGVAVVDQNGALRGFWKDDAEGRGNAINAARLLWRHGVKP